MKKRVFILTSEPPERFGGVERLVSQMTRQLEERGYGVEAFHKENSLPPGLKSPSSWLGRQFSDAMLGFFVGREASRHLSPDVVAIISQGPIGWYPFRWPGGALKKIHFYHGTYWGVAESIRPFITYRGYLKMKWWDAKVLERLSGRGKLCVCNSDQTREEGRRLFGYACETVWLPMDTGFFRPLDRAHCRSALGLPPDKCIGLFAGTAQPNKGFPVVRALIRLFPQLHWALLFRGAPPDGLQPSAQITIFEDIPDEQMPLLYNAADFSVCPSRYEGFAYVVAEALACGTPVVAGPTGASGLFLREPPLDRLFISDPENVDGFRAAVSAVLADPSLYRQIVLEKVRPEIEARMSPPSWWKRFAEVTGL
jgi:glycosyltransferase involved in cell wall biosynthesis